MFKLLKWIYDLGKKHERRRIELAIRNYKYPQQLDATENDFTIPEDMRRQAAHQRHEFEEAIRGIVYPSRIERRERSILDD